MFKTKITGKVSVAAVPLYYPSEKGNMKFVVKTPSGSFPIMIAQTLLEKTVLMLGMKLWLMLI